MKKFWRFVRLTLYYWFILALILSATLFISWLLVYHMFILFIIVVLVGVSSRAAFKVWGTY